MTIHATHRAWERFGLALSKDDMRQLADRCRKGEGCVETFRGKRRHALVFGEQVLWAIYDPRSHKIVTITDGSVARGVTRRGSRHQWRRHH